MLGQLLLTYETFSWSFPSKISSDGEFSPYSSSDIISDSETGGMSESLGDPLQVTFLDLARVCVLGDDSPKVISEKVFGDRGISLSGSLTDLLGVDFGRHTFSSIFVSGICLHRFSDVSESSEPPDGLRVRSTTSDSSDSIVDEAEELVPKSTDILLRLIVVSGRVGIVVKRSGFIRSLWVLIDLDREYGIFLVFETFCFFLPLVS